MLISKKQLVNHMCSTDDTRKALHCICFGAEGAYSTDGKCVLLVPYPHKDNNTYYASDAVQAAAEAEFVRPLLINRQDAKEVAAVAKNVDLPYSGWRRTTHVKQQAMVAVLDAEPQAEAQQSAACTIHYIDDKADKSITVKRRFDGTGNFPDVAQFFKPAENCSKLVFDARLLEKLLRQIIAASVSEQKYVEFVIQQPNDRGRILEPAQINTRGNDEANSHSVRAVLMPVRIG